MYLEGKRRSIRSNFTSSAEGIVAADEIVMDRAMKRVAV
jgi:hypothetical protein